MRKIYLLIYLLSAMWYAFSPHEALAQQVEEPTEISGKISDSETGESLPGATVLVKGGTEGTVADIDGQFKLNVSDPNATLVISFVGYLSQETVLNGRSTVDIAMTMDIEALDEVVVVGYGTVRKSDATGSVASINSNDFNRGAVNSPQELILGKTAGVTVTSNSGAPGNTSTIRIRGGSSMSASNDPLIVIDGVPIDNTPTGGSPNVLSSINPNDIETFSILKDASATAIYGSRAANGVIIITTKRGQSGLNFDYNFTGTLYTTPKKVEVYSGDEFRALVNDQYAGEPTVLDLLGTENTDWQEEIYQDAFGQDHNFGVSGGIKNLNYRVSLGYNNTDGILKTYNFERTTLAVALDPTLLNGRLKVQINAKGMLNNNNFAEQNAIGNAIAYDPTKPVYDGNIRWRGYTTWTVGGIDGTSINLAPANPVAQLALTDNTSTVKRSIGNMKFDFEVLKGLRANLNLGYDYQKSEGHNNVLDSTQWVYVPTVAGGRINPYEDSRENQLLDFYVNYEKDLPSVDSKFDVMAGYSWSHFHRSNSDSLLNAYRTESTEAKSFESEYYLVSFFGRANYNLKNKYILTATLRNDGTSRFSPDTRWGWFPAVAFAWHAANEDFLNTSAVVSDLKVRLGFGITGQQDLNTGNDYPYMTTYTVSDNASRYPFGSTYYNTYRPDGYDANIKWETTTTYNAGIDFGLIDNRVTGSVDVYFKKTDDLLNTVDVPVGTNFSARVLTNVGSMENKGIELNLNWLVIDSDDWKWKLNYNVYYNHNELTKLNLNDDPDYIVQTGAVGGTTSGTIQVQKLGNAVNSFYVYEQVYDTNGNPIEDAYVDRNDDGIINSSDLYVYHNPAAQIAMGINSWLSYKNFDFSITGRAHLNNYVYNNVASSSTYMGLYNSMEYLSNMSTQADDTKFVNGVNTRFSDHYIENASFFRIDNINLAYNFDDAFNGLMNLRLSAGVQNALVITDYKGLDPEISGGLDNNFFPRTRSFIVGLRAQF
ncbi:iron complex outermembrane recepter protein [Reichenbachiella faecimaris]|uniref:Iron complex outermembrane recepter protein n=1 Tax=Reichenbachiella faecimaris TaxID=692418 RepID=A0A1W2GMS8_REIFA|nr:TonB-dependent receptor [Reichenbachiella faecimaris]SMD37957.1 iron complex outermembrane recepter protein [Reichenbachiella faecimaris]